MFKIVQKIRIEYKVDEDRDENDDREGMQKLRAMAELFDLEYEAWEVGGAKSNDEDYDEYQIIKVEYEPKKSVTGEYVDLYQLLSTEEEDICVELMSTEEAA